MKPGSKRYSKPPLKLAKLIPLVQILDLILVNQEIHVHRLNPLFRGIYRHE